MPRADIYKQTSWKNGPPILMASFQDLPPATGSPHASKTIRFLAFCPKIEHIITSVSGQGVFILCKAQLFIKIPSISVVWIVVSSHYFPHCSSPAWSLSLSIPVCRLGDLITLNLFLTGSNCPMHCFAVSSNWLAIQLLTLTAPQITGTKIIPRLIICL